MEYVLIGIVCFITGVAIAIPINARLYFKKRKVGVLRLDRSDGIHMFLEIDDSSKLEMIEKHRYVLFEVLDESYIQQK